MTSDEIEFLIVQHLDGTLAADEATRLDAILATDAEARAMLAEHQRLVGALRAMPAVPHVDGAWLRSQIAGALDEADAPAVSFKLPSWFLWAGPIAGAALLMITLTLGVFLHRDDGDPVPTNLASPTTPVAQVSVAPMMSVATAAPRQMAVSVGAPANLSPQLVTALFLTEQLPSSGRIVLRPAGHAERSAFE